MPEEKVEDFISLWKKKMETEVKKPSGIEKTLDRIREIEKQNEALRNKIKQNVELISKTEDIVSDNVDDQKVLKIEIKEAEIVGRKSIREIQEENLKLYERVKNITKSLMESEDLIRTKDSEMSSLQNKIINLTYQMESLSSSLSEKEQSQSQALIEELKSELVKRKSQLNEFEQKIKSLNVEKENLTEMLIEKESAQNLDNIVPVDNSKNAAIPSQTSSNILELLCQDLQTDLNKYKRIVEQLTLEKNELQEKVEGSGFQFDPEEIKELKKENEELKNELSKLQASLQSKTTEPQPKFSVEIYEKQIEELHKQIRERDILIAELRSSLSSQITVPTGPISNLVGELQGRIEKLKISLDEKDKIIAELKTS